MWCLRACSRWLASRVVARVGASRGLAVDLPAPALDRAHRQCEDGDGSVCRRMFLGHAGGFQHIKGVIERDVGLRRRLRSTSRHTNT